MDFDELVKTVQKVDLLYNTISKQKLSGGSPSFARGRGVVFDTVRKYEAGDDVRNINWSVTARFRETYVNTFNEDKMRRIWLLIDVSGSSALGSYRRRKIDLEMETGATLAYNAIRKNDSVGVIFFSDKIEKLLMPVKGMSGFWHIAQTMVNCNPCAGTTDLRCALDFLMKINCTGSLVFILSDFLTAGYEQACAIFAQHNDVLTIRVQTKVEQSLPKLGWVRLQDIESGRKRWVNTSSRSFAKAYQQQQAEGQSSYMSFVRQNAIPHIDVDTDADVVEKLLILMS